MSKQFAFFAVISLLALAGCAVDHGSDTRVDTKVVGHMSGPADSAPAPNVPPQAAKVIPGASTGK